MNKHTAWLDIREWLTAAAIALIGSFILFDRNPGINWAIWVALAALATIVSHGSSGLRLSRPSVLLAAAATLAAGAATRTTDINVHVGIFWLTAVTLAVLLCSIAADQWTEIGLFRLASSPFLAAAKVVTSSAREAASAIRRATDSPSRPLLRRVLIVAPVVIVLLLLLGGADPLIHSALREIGLWIPTITVSASAVFFAVLLVVLIGAGSRLPDLKVTLPRREPGPAYGPTHKDVMVLVAATLSTLVLFIILQTIYLFVQPPGEPGNGVTYAEYARRGFGQLCVVVTIVAAVVLFAEKFRDAGDASRTRSLRRLELASIGAAGLVLASALRRVVLYEQAYGYTLARVHASAYIVFIAGFLILLALELRRGGVGSTLTRRSAALGFAVVITILYWNDQAWIMNRNVDRIRATGKFDVSYAAALSHDAFPVLVQRRGELPAGAWDEIRAKAACKPLHRDPEWYEWNPVRSAAQTARATAQIVDAPKCARRRD